MFEAIVKGLVLGILLGISVGPVIFSIIKQSLNNGHGAVMHLLWVCLSAILF